MQIVGWVDEAQEMDPVLLTLWAGAAWFNPVTGVKVAEASDVDVMVVLDHEPVRRTWPAGVERDA